MKKSEIVVGGVYSNGKGRVRKVIDVGPQYVLYSAQETTDCLRYEIIKDGSKRNRLAGSNGDSTRTSFASWAKERVE